MSLASQGAALASRVAREFKTLRSELASKVDKSGATFNIRDYGASTIFIDNRSAIQAAITAAGDRAAATGSQSVVLVPAATFNVKATAYRTFSLRPNVTILGEDRKGSRIRVHESSGDWAYLFAYPSTGHCDNAAVRNLTVDGGANTNPTATKTDWTTARTLFQIIGQNFTIEGCDLIVNGVWALHHVGDNPRIVNNDITVDMSGYTLGWFDQSILWGSSSGGRIAGNTFTAKEATTNTFVVQTAIEWQGHRNRFSGNTTAPGSRFTRGFIFTANTYYDAQAGFHPATPKGAVDSVIEDNAMTCTKYGVEVWGMVVVDPQPIAGLRIRGNAFTMDNASTVGASAGVTMYVGRAGAGGNDGTQTSPVVDLKISDNRVSFNARRISYSLDTGDAGVRLFTEVPITGAVISGNRISNSGAFGVSANVFDPSAAWVDRLDIVGDNVFTDVRQPVGIGRNVRNWRVEGNVFEQPSTYATFSDNMIETVANRANDYPDETGGIVRRNTIRTASGHKPFYPVRDQGVAQSAYPASRGYVVEQMGAQMQAPGVPVTVGANDVVRRASDGAFVKAQFAAGATLGTLTGVTIAKVIADDTMTVNDGSKLNPGDVLSLPYQAPFASGSAVVVAVVGNTVRTGAKHLAVASGQVATTAEGKALTYYSAVVTVA